MPRIGGGAADVWMVLALVGRAVDRAGRRLERTFSPGEWAVLADALVGRLGPRSFLDEPHPLAVQLADAVEMAHEAIGLGDDHLGGPGAGDDGIVRLVHRLRALPAIEALAVLAAVRFRAGHPEVASGPWYKVKTRAAAPGSRASAPVYRLEFSGRGLDGTHAAAWSPPSRSRRNWLGVRWP